MSKTTFAALMLSLFTNFSKEGFLAPAFSREKLKYV
jgi:hypothetical protein